MAIGAFRNLSKAQQKARLTQRREKQMARAAEWADVKRSARWAYGVAKTPSNVMKAVRANIGSEKPVIWTPSKQLANIRSSVNSIAKNEVQGAFSEVKSDLRENRALKNASPAERSAAKRRSDAIYNERRRAKRLVNRLEMDAATQFGAERRATQAYISKLKSEISKTYQPKRATDAAYARQEQAVANLRSMRAESAVRNAAAREDLVFRHQLAQAAKGSRTIWGSGYESQSRFRLFMNATKRYWQGGDEAGRLSRIEQATGKSLGQVWEEVMAQNETAVKEIHKRSLEKNITDTFEEGFFGEFGGVEKDPEDSPTFLDLTVAHVVL